MFLLNCWTSLKRPKFQKLPSLMFSIRQQSPITSPVQPLALVSSNEPCLLLKATLFREGFENKLNTFLFPRDSLTSNSMFEKCSCQGCLLQLWFSRNLSVGVKLLSARSTKGPRKLWSENGDLLRSFPTGILK